MSQLTVSKFEVFICVGGVKYALRQIFFLVEGHLYKHLSCVAQNDPVLQKPLSFYLQNHFILLLCFDRPLTAVICQRPKLSLHMI